MTFWDWIFWDMSRMRLFKTNKFMGCLDQDQSRLSKICWDWNFFKGLAKRREWLYCRKSVVILSEECDYIFFMKIVAAYIAASSQMQCTYSPQTKILYFVFLSLCHKINSGNSEHTLVLLFFEGVYHFHYHIILWNKTDYGLLIH